jgi:2-oxoglutarate dehydrogenase E1 component
MLADIFERYPGAVEVRWVQEEPRNMGGWFFVEPRLREMLGRGVSYIGRAASASPATGSHTIHQMEQKQLVGEAFS